MHSARFTEGWGIAGGFACIGTVALQIPMSIKVPTGLSQAMSTVEIQAGIACIGINLLSIDNSCEEQFVICIVGIDQRIQQGQSSLRMYMESRGI